MPLFYFFLLCSFLFAGIFYAIRIYAKLPSFVVLPRRTSSTVFVRAPRRNQFCVSPNNVEYVLERKTIVNLCPSLTVAFSTAESKSYPIYIGRGLLSSLELLKPYLHREVCIVSDETVAPLYLGLVESQLRLLVDQVKTVVLPAGETTKAMASAEKVWQVLLENRFSRRVLLVALGGGVVGDLTGFVASCYQRGVPFVQIPTTLLAQVDSSVGGKTGVNHPLGKNMIGAFCQPEAVLIDPQTLSTLPRRELAAGLAEVIKYGFIYDKAFFSWCVQNWADLLMLDDGKISYAIKRSCEIKAEVVGKDERESGLRAILNFGHTFGHAIESFTQYRTWLHGEAVAVGMLMALDLSRRMGRVDDATIRVTRALFEEAGLPLKPPAEMGESDFIRFMSQDKKNINQKIRLVLLSALGCAEITEDYQQGVLSETIRAFVQPCG